MVHLVEMADWMWMAQLIEWAKWKALLIEKAISNSDMKKDFT